MKTVPPSPRPPFLHLVAVATIILAALFLGLSGGKRTAHPSATPAPVASARATAPPATPPAASPIEPAAPAVLKLRPFAVARETGAHEWTAEDGRSPEVIARLAHNPAEMRRMTDENAIITRRQLVYRKETAAALLEKARLTGEAVRAFTLPGLDGTELKVEVLSADLAPSGLSGSFRGRLAGQNRSLVTLAFNVTREAFTVVSPVDGLFLQGEPREPGEVVVKSMKPDAFDHVKCDTEPGCCGQ